MSWDTHLREFYGRLAYRPVLPKDVRPQIGKIEWTKVLGATSLRRSELFPAPAAIQKCVLPIFCTIQIRFSLPDPTRTIGSGGAILKAAADRFDAP